MKLSQPILWLLTAILGGALPLASQGATFPVDQCAADRYGQSLNCTANDLEFAKDAEILSVDGVPGVTACVAGSTVTMELGFTLQAGQPARYNVGVFVGNQGKDIKLTSAGGGNSSCSVATFTPPDYGFLDLDHNPCGDVSDRQLLYPKVTAEVLCQPSADGRVLLPGLLSWDEQVNACSGPQSPVPGTRAKCNASSSIDSGVTAQAQLTVYKQTIGEPAGPAASFTFTPSGTPTPDPSAPFSLSNGDSRTIQVPYGPGPTAQVDVVEAVSPGWTQRPPVCVDAAGAPAGANVTIQPDGVSATFDATHSAYHCLFVNVYGITAPPPAGDLAITKGVDDPTPYLGGSVTFSLQASNLGPLAATGVKVRDPLPAGLVFLSATATKGQYDPAQGLWTIADMAVGEVQQLHISVRVDQPGLKLNLALISGDLDEQELRNNIALALVRPWLISNPSGAQAIATWPPAAAALLALLLGMAALRALARRRASATWK